MKMSKTKTTTTAHGEVQYKVVECDSCGANIMEGDEYEFTIGDRNGVACEHCVNEGPASFPEKTYEWSINNLSWDGKVDFLVILLLFPLLVPVSLIIAPTNSADDWDKGYATACFSAVLWALLIGLLWTLVIA